jgi:choline dehydrogenase-like flavoprotein
MTVEHRNGNTIMSSQKTIAAECVIVGSGAGGALTASFLAGRGKEVLILEEGPKVSLRGDAVRMTEAVPALFRDGGLLPVLSNTNFVMTEGRCLGGSTMINAALINRPSRETVEAWVEDYAIKDLAYARLMQDHDAIENTLGVEILDQSENKADIFFKRGASTQNLLGRDLPTAARKEDGVLRKNNMEETFLKHADQHGARALVNCAAYRIHFDGNRATSLLALAHDTIGRPHLITITFKELFVCAGAIQTPLLLRRSGIVRNIGNSLQLHPMLRVVAEFNTPMHTYAHPMSSFQVKLPDSGATLGASISSPPMLASVLSLGNVPREQFARIIQNAALYYVAIHPHTLGRIRPLPFSKSGYAVRYRLSPHDLKNASVGFARLAQVLFAAGARALYPALTGARPIKNQTESDRYLEEMLLKKSLNFISIHSFSSCPMGEDEDYSALDSFGKLHGIENVYVNDASAMPSSPGANPQGPLMALALRNLTKNFG